MCALLWSFRSASPFRTGLWNLNGKGNRKAAALGGWHSEVFTKDFVLCISLYLLPKIQKFYSVLLSSTQFSQISPRET